MVEAQKIAKVIALNSARLLERRNVVLDIHFGRAIAPEHLVTGLVLELSNIAVLGDGSAVQRDRLVVSHLAADRLQGVVVVELDIGTVGAVGEVGHVESHVKRAADRHVEADLGRLRTLHPVRHLARLQRLPQ